MEQKVHKRNFVLVTDEGRSQKWGKRSFLMQNGVFPFPNIAAIFSDNSIMPVYLYS